jgi:hypothetical protein
MCENVARSLVNTYGLKRYLKFDGDRPWLDVEGVVLIDEVDAHLLFRR